ncbi:replication protein A 70 kDa DNA-binding subunit B-like [Arachis stenosperma]|uniref:replication protein A 70 kDa DNA-binding subunit B-like n=1 Tax=Arachis stenosperma TaxID=217475 RepID=UPI0025AD3CA0|nr:replication protein A 70 kDa DNA-binding subunit B-like [Arachis stenosperma]
MDEHFDLVSDVNAKKLAWNFKVFVIRVWTTPNKFNVNEIGSIEMVLQDKQGGRIYATIPRSLAKKYISVILEFHMYTMSNFIVVDNMTKKKNGVSRWVLVFSHRTRVEHIENPTFPLEAFRFRNLAEMHTVEKVEDLELFDIIGEIVGKEDPRELVTSKGIETKRLVVIVEDLEWNGKTSVQSHFELSKVHVNPELKEVMSFKKSLMSGSESTSVRISHQSTQSSWVGTDELNNGMAIVKTIEQVLKSVEEGPTWIAGTIVSINAGKDDWFYKACRRCPKKVETPIGNRYECAKCGHTHGCAALRYKVEVMVFDGTGSITLLLWDRETNQLCGKAAEKIVEEDDAKEDEYPKSLDNMMDRMVLFKINVKSGNIKHYDQIYTVMKVCDDEETVAKNKPQQMDVSTSMNITENRGSNTLEMSGHVVNLKNDNDPQLTVDSMEDCVESLKYKTPAKRIAGSLKYGSVVDEECQLSTNRFTRKGGKKLKSQTSEADN